MPKSCCITQYKHPYARRRLCSKVVQVERDSHPSTIFVCYRLKDHWKCGYCNWGNIVPKNGYVCRVCDAIVISVFSDVP